MTRRSPATLQVAPPTLEPGPVLLHQLAELSASSAPAVRTARRAAVRALAGAATVAVIGGTTWVAGAVPGSGFGTRHHDGPTSSDVTSTGEAAAGTPPSDGAASAPGSPWSPGLPGTRISAPPAVRIPTDRHDHPGRHGGQGGHDADGHPGEAKHLAKGHAKHHGNGHAYGHDKTPPSGHGHAYGHDKTPPGHTGEHGKGHGKGHGHSKGHSHGHGSSHSHGHHGGGGKHHPKGRGHH